MRIWVSSRTVYSMSTPWRVKGTVGFDGFTYFKGEVLSPMKEGAEGGELLQEL